jgi:hypothetical protein
MNDELDDLRVGRPRMRTGARFASPLGDQACPTRFVMPTLLQVLAGDGENRLAGTTFAGESGIDHLGYPPPDRTKLRGRRGRCVCCGRLETSSATTENGKQLVRHNAHKKICDYFLLDQMTAQLLAIIEEAGRPQGTEPRATVTAARAHSCVTITNAYIRLGDLAPWLWTQGESTSHQAKRSEAAARRGERRRGCVHSFGKLLPRNPQKPSLRN